MKCFWRKSVLSVLVLCIAAQISGCASSGNGSADEGSEIKTEIITENVAEQATENPTENITEGVTHEEKETKPEEPDIMSVTSWSEPDLSDFREVFYPGFELETAVIDGKSYRKFVADNGWYVIEKSKNGWEKDYIIEIGREGQGKEYPICDTIGGISFGWHIAYSKNGETSVAPRIFWSDVTGDGQEDICIRVDYFDFENWLMGKTATCNLYIYDCANDNFITVAGDSLHERFENEITVSDIAVSADGDLSLSAAESGEKRDFILETTVSEDRVLEGCWLDKDAQYIMVRDGKISMGYWIRIITRPESGWNGMDGSIIDGPLVYKTLEYDAEKGCFEPMGKAQMELIDSFKYADTEDFRSIYWENYIKEHREQ
ncbi:MAG: hypothetical protein HDT13_10300 [Butyrivibrio sp.]|nr:hypothetical protein [Butyrivibrio sp.]